MIEIRLPRGLWKYDPETPLGKAGGFGEVFAGEGNNYDSLAVKRLFITKSEAAHRELRIADDLANRQLKYVMPILDAGQDIDSDFYLIVMPKAEKSLQDEIERVGTFKETESVAILKQIADGLQEVQDIVHRDLKPSNILYHDGKWKIADFGISRFVEESTSINTLKSFLTYSYAAPEQWLLERTTYATDVYALGCIAYSLLTGHPPFFGPSDEDYREQHLTLQPPLLENIQPRLKSLLLSMLRKPQAARPTLERIVTLLDEISKENLKPVESPGFQSLAQVGVADVVASAQADISKSAQAKLEREREELANNAIHILRNLAESFYIRCKDVALTLRRIDNLPHMPHLREDLFGARLGNASIQISLFNPIFGYLIPKDALQNSGWDVVVGAIVTVTQGEPKPYKWSANLWYTNLGAGTDFRWWEVSYFNIYPNTGNLPFEPHAVTDIKDADLAASRVMHSISFATKPKPIDDEDSDDFFNRWAEILAKAYNGQLAYPPHLPLS